MRTKIINIGNSRGIRIPKPLLKESGLDSEVEISAKRGEIRMKAVNPAGPSINNVARLSEKALSKDWDRPEEDVAWTNL